MLVSYLLVHSDDTFYDSITVNDYDYDPDSWDNGGDGLGLDMYGL